MKSKNSLSRKAGGSTWVCILAVGLIVATPVLTAASPVPGAGHGRGSTTAPDSVGFWIKVASLGIQLLANIITALEEIEKYEEYNPPQAPPRADGPPWQPTEDPAPRVLPID